MRVALNSPLLLAAALLPAAQAVDLDVNDPSSIRSAAQAIANNLMTNFGVDLTPGSPSTGLIPQPVFWWESGGLWGAMVDYTYYTGDDTWQQDAENTLYEQSGPNFDLIVPSQAFDEGNDDQGFWALTVAAAFEYGLPSINGLSYPEVAANAFNELVSRWITVGEQTCGGGLKWQFYTSNRGYDYKSTISQGAFFQLAARLAHYTGNSTYSDWAEKIWDWTTGVGFITSDYHVLDGASDLTNCAPVVQFEWSYNAGVFIYGAAAMYAVTGDSVWEQRLQGLLNAAQYLFFTPFSNATGIMYESACEQYNTCGTDQLSFKAYLARWMAKATVLAPSISNQVWGLLEATAKAAAQSCSGGADGTTCGEKWYVKGFDGNSGVGQQLSALECIQALLVKDSLQPKLKQGYAAVSVPSSYPQAPATTAPAVSSGGSSGGGGGGNGGGGGGGGVATAPASTTSVSSKFSLDSALTTAPVPATSHARTSSNVVVPSEQPSSTASPEIDPPPSTSTSALETATSTRPRRSTTSIRLPHSKTSIPNTTVTRVAVASNAQKSSSTSTAAAASIPRPTNGVVAGAVVGVLAYAGAALI